MAAEIIKLAVIVSSVYLFYVSFASLDLGLGLDRVGRSLGTVVLDYKTGLLLAVG